MSIVVFLDGPPEQFEHSDLGLRARAVLGDRWNGWLRPVATAEELGRFLDAWRSNDPNGVWGYVTEVGDQLICTRSDGTPDEAETFPSVGTSLEGEGLYDLTGWAWVDAEYGSGRA